MLLPGAILAAEDTPENSDEQKLSASAKVIENPPHSWSFPMKHSRSLAGALIVGSVVVASMFAAAPASAATLPAGQKISVIDNVDAQFYNVSPATAIATPVGTPTPIATEISGVDVDDAGHGYAIATLFEYEEPEGDEQFGDRFPSEGWLYQADANTGALSDGKQIRIDDGGNDPVWANECTAIDYTAGVITAVCYTYGNVRIGYVGTIDASGAEAVLTADTFLWEQDGTDIYFTAIAIDPTDGTLYGFSLTFTNHIWTITLDGADPVKVSEDSIGYTVAAADFDRSGQLWLSVVPTIVPSALNASIYQLATFDFAALEVVPVDNFASEDPYAIAAPTALTVWGVLAATGSAMSIAPAVAASGVLLLGAILAAGTMMLRRRSADV
jgi:hypothetical protein